MPITLFNQYVLAMAVDGKEIPIWLNSFKELSICANVETRLPTLRLQYRDEGNYLHDYAPLIDGSKVTILMHSAVMSDPEPPAIMTFNITSSGFQPDGNALTFQAVGVLDHIDYLRAFAEKPIEANSSDAISQLATQVGLTPDVDTTQDKMIWRPTKEYIGDFARSIAQRGYAGKSSVMSLGISDNATLHYKDLSKLAQSSAGRRVTAMEFVNPVTGDIPYLAWKVVSVGGFSNFYYGYGTQIVQELLTGSAGFFSQMLSGIFGSGGSGLSSAISGLLGGMVRNEYAPANSKNTHKEFYKAEKQNKQGAALFSNIVHFVTHQATDLKLYDVVEFLPTLPTTNQISSLVAGKYVVSGKTRFIERLHYLEKIELSAQAYNAGSGGSGGGAAP